jgi:hypothetical protein
VDEAAKAPTEVASEAVVKGPVVVARKAAETNLAENVQRT